MMARDVSIDGSHGEGGGQVLRNAISFAAILNKAIKINNIRAGRTKPGLQAQHMTGLSLCTEIRGGKLDGCWLGSTEVSYTPPADDKAEARIEYVGDTRTAGSICLVLQAALPVALFSRSMPTDLILKGGTNASMAPQYDYWEKVFLPTLISQCGFPTDLIEHRVVRRGYYPRGGGEVMIEVTPWQKPLPPIILKDRGDVSSIEIHCYYAGAVPRTVAYEMAEAAKTFLKKAGILIEPDVDIVHEMKSMGSGCGILLVATTTTDCLLAGSALGSPNKPAIEVGREAAEELVATLRDGGCVDEWLQDQLILFMALGDGISEVLTGSLTMHTQTAIWTAEQMSGAKFEVKRLEEGEGGNNAEGYGKDGRIPGKHLIRCIGMNFVNKAL
ncbi:RNA-3'-phosphate cyclase [Fragilaria crotonensis]|nr:RNA-3'-phosphate cyclase [Fragilaria crotonensis]